MAGESLKEPFLTLVFFGLVVLTVAGRDVPSANSGDQQRGGQTATDTMAAKRMGTANAHQWFADPEQGWIRVEKRSEAEAKRDRNRSKNSGNPAGILGEY